MSLKLADQVCRYRDRSFTLRSLRFLEVPSTTFSVDQHCSHDCHCTLVKIAIFPLQPRVFFGTHHLESGTALSVDGTEQASRGVATGDTIIALGGVPDPLENKMSRVNDGNP